MWQRLGEHVVVRRSGYCATNSVVVTGPGRIALLVDPGVSGPDLADLDDYLTEHELTPVAAVATHPHWDHVLWHRDWRHRWPDLPRWAHRGCVQRCLTERELLIAEGRRELPDLDTEALGELTALTEAAVTVPWPGPTVRLWRHDGHAVGHLALLVEPDGVLVAGDMLSDIEIPLLDLTGADPLRDYLSGLSMLAGITGVSAVVPGHGSVGDGAELGRRLRADVGYLRGLGLPGQGGAAGVEPLDPRLPGAPAWMVGHHEAQRRVVRDGMPSTGRKHLS